MSFKSRENQGRAERCGTEAKNVKFNAPNIEFVTSFAVRKHYVCGCLPSLGDLRSTGGHLKSYYVMSSILRVQAVLILFWFESPSAFWLSSVLFHFCSSSYFQNSYYIRIIYIYIHIICRGKWEIGENRWKILPNYASCVNCLGT